MSEAICPKCGNSFTRNKAWQKYCGKICNQMAYLERKLEKMRKDPLHTLDLDLSLNGPSEVQEAEWERRAILAEGTAQEKERKAKAEQFARRAGLLDDEPTPPKSQEPNAIEDWFKK